jgi:membrane protein DedA with SNARE-associated domain
MPDLNQIIADYGPLAIFLLILIEDFGIPLPGETALISAALLASQGKMSISWLLLAAWVGAVIGDNIGYAIGRFGGRRLVVRYGSRVGITYARLARIEQFFARRGNVVVLVARFFAGLRQLNGIVAGIGRMPVWQFMLYNAIGAMLWVAVWGLGIYWFGQNLEHLFDQLGPIIYGIIAAAVALLAAYLIWRFIRHRSQDS